MLTWLTSFSRQFNLIGILYVALVLVLSAHRENVLSMTQTVVITGASSGIGRSLALEYARNGARLGLLSIDHDALAEAAEKCRVLGAIVRTAVIDVTARAQLAAWLDEFDHDMPVDILIANAGVLAGPSAGAPIEPAEASQALMNTNVIGVLNTVHPLLPRMLARQRGHIALMSSIAGFVPLPQLPSYSASKAAVLSYGLALRASLRLHGVAVSAICPGFVATPMTRQICGWTPFQISADDAARRIYRGIERNSAIITFPWYFAWAMRVGGILPDVLRRYTISSAGFYMAPQK